MKKLKFDLQLFAVSANATKLADMINPEVIKDMISANLPKAIKFTNITTIDTTLQGQPGDTITVPMYAYIGDAKDVAEGEAIDISKLTATTTKATIKKAGKAVEITDEAVLSGYGDTVGETVKQLNLSMASKIEEDVVTALGTATITLDKSTEVISYDGIVSTVDLFAEEADATKVLFIHPKQLTQIRKSADFIDKTKYGADVMMTGAIGTICGVQVVVSRRVPNTNSTFTNFLVQTSPAAEDGTPSLPPVSILLKRGVNLETDRDILTKSTILSVDSHYVAYLSNPARAIKITFKEA